MNLYEELVCLQAFPTSAQPFSWKDKAMVHLVCIIDQPSPSFPICSTILHCLQCSHMQFTLFFRHRVSLTYDEVHIKKI